MILELPILLDGATGTELQKRGFSGDGCAEAWTLAHPEAIVELQRAYVQNGSQIVYSPTFGANRVKLESHGLFGKVEEYNRQLVALSRRAAGDAALVAGDISPTGLFLYPLGETTFEELFDVYAEQAAALEAAGVDLFVVETMVTLAEARAAVLAVRSVSSKPVFVSFSCDEQGKTLSGTDITAAALVMQGMGISAFGMNCSTGPVQMLPHLQRLSRYAQVPLLAKPNAGLPQVENGKTVYHCPPQEFAACAGDMAAAGVGIFGGCCGTTPEHIAALADRLRGQAVAPPAFAFDELLPCATGQRALPLSPDTPVGTVLCCTDDLEDALIGAADSDEPVVALSIDSREQLQTFADCQHLIQKPLCLVCDDAVLLEQALRQYQGRALYEGSLSDEVLLPLCERYGLIL